MTDEEMFEVPGSKLVQLREDIAKLDDALDLARNTIASLREDNKLHEDFIIECTELLPPSYDADEAAEAIILRFLKDMQEIGRIIAKLTADYR